MSPSGDAQWTCPNPRQGVQSESPNHGRKGNTMTENASGTPQVASDTPQVPPSQKTGERLRELHDIGDKTPEEILDEQ